jgi:hypothetical protein
MVTDAMPIGVLRALTEGDLDGDWVAGAALAMMSGRGVPRLCNREGIRWWSLI